MNRILRRRPAPQRTRSMLIPFTAAALLSACAGTLQPPASPPQTSATADREGAVVWPWTVTVPTVDSLTTEVLAPAIRLHRIYRDAAPLRAFVLDIDLAGCVSLRAIKGAPTAVGRNTTSTLLQTLPAADGPVAAVNADFFSFTPAGVPTGAHVDRGRVIAGPGTRPVFGVDSAGMPFISTLQVEGIITTPRARLHISRWNRSAADGISMLDQHWGQPADSSVTIARWTLAPIDGAAPRRYVVAAASRDQVARGDTLVVLASAGLTTGDTVQLQHRLEPRQPVEAVGGFPLLLRHGVVVADSTNSGAVGFRGLNPRTAVGIGAAGRRLLLLVADGRQPGVSTGLTIDETAQLLQLMGATDALNLDGGGSSAMVLAAGVGQRATSRDVAVRTSGQNAPTLVNHPSDATGERAVANALAVLSSCRQ